MRIHYDLCLTSSTSILSTKWHKSQTGIVPNAGFSSISYHTIANHISKVHIAFSIDLIDNALDWSSDTTKMELPLIILTIGYPKRSFFLVQKQVLNAAPLYHRLLILCLLKLVVLSSHKCNRKPSKVNGCIPKKAVGTSTDSPSLQTWLSVQKMAQFRSF